MRKPLDILSLLLRLSRASTKSTFTLHQPHLLDRSCSTDVSLVDQQYHDRSHSSVNINAKACDRPNMSPVSTASSPASSASATSSKYQEQLKGMNQYAIDALGLSNRKKHIAATTSSGSHNGVSYLINGVSTSHNKPLLSRADQDSGGRTAWSSDVCVNGKYISAKFWYEGNRTAQAAEDAAQRALMDLGQLARPA